MAARDVLLKLATEAASDPSRAAPIARMLADMLGAAEETEGKTPDGYLYAGAHKWFAIASDVHPEPLPPATGAVPITSTANRPIQIRTPFDALLVGVAGWSELDYSQLTLAVAANVGGVSQAPDFRDFFSVDWDVDARTSFETDGHERLMLPAAVVVGTQLKPRPMAWKLRRNQTINVRFRNITNAQFGASAFSSLHNLPLKRVAIAFFALNLEAP